VTNGGKDEANAERLTPNAERRMGEDGGQRTRRRNGKLRKLAFESF
jgi:hypothetical protein